MRLNPRVVFAVLLLLVGIALAVGQSPNLTSLTTQVSVLTADEPNALKVVMPLPYREPDRRLLAPVAPEEFDRTWPLSERGIGKRTDHPAEG